MVFLALIYLNFKKAQTRYQDNSPSQISINFVDIPDTVRVNQRVNLAWSVSAPADFKTTNTTIFYSQVSSPSAITKNDSPDAAGYQFSLPDYQKGVFSLPDTFDGFIAFTSPGDYYLRGYALVRDNHLWTAEKHIKVSP